MRAARPYADRFGYRYSHAVQDYWSPNLIAALGIRLAKRTSKDIADDRAANARAMLRATLTPTKG
jgi:hypothetical protein